MRTRWAASRALRSGTDSVAEKPKHWMKEAFANAHGQFKAKAEKAGKSTAAFAKEKEGAPGKTGKQARLAEVGIKASKSRAKSRYTAATVS